MRNVRYVLISDKRKMKTLENIHGTGTFAPVKNVLDASP